MLENPVIKCAKLQKKVCIRAKESVHNFSYFRITQSNIRYKMPVVVILQFTIEKTTYLLYLQNCV